MLIKCFSRFFEQKCFLNVRICFFFLSFSLVNDTFFGFWTVDLTKKIKNFHSSFWIFGKLLCTFITILCNVTDGVIIS